MQASHIVFTVRRYAGMVYAVVVCLSVYVSQAGIVSTAKHRITQTMQHDSPVFCYQRCLRNSPGDRPGSTLTGAPDACGVG